MINSVLVSDYQLWLLTITCFICQQNIYFNHKLDHTVLIVNLKICFYPIMCIHDVIFFAATACLIWRLFVFIVGYYEYLRYFYRFTCDTLLHECFKHNKLPLLKLGCWSYHQILNYNQADWMVFMMASLGVKFDNTIPHKILITFPVDVVLADSIKRFLFTKD